MELIIYRGEEEIETDKLPDIMICDTWDELETAVHAAYEREAAAQGGPRMPFRAEDGTHMVRMADIVTLFGTGHRVCLQLTDGTVLTSKTLRTPTATACRPYLERGRFLQTFRARFVNFEHISVVMPRGVRLKDGTVLPMSQGSYRKWKDEQGIASAPPCHSEEGNDEESFPGGDRTGALGFSYGKTERG